VVTFGGEHLLGLTIQEAEALTERGADGDGYSHSLRGHLGISLRLASRLSEVSFRSRGQSGPHRQDDYVV